MRSGTARARAETEWARVQERTEARSRVERFNDGALEVLILVARVYSVVGVVSVVWICPLLVMFFGLAGGIIAAGHVVLAFGGGYWSWWYYGNDEWRANSRGR